jgi:prevent-host-death family protein
MPEVGAYEAKTHLSELLERVSKGERIVITKHGTPVAVLAPISDRELRPTLEVIADLRDFREGHTLGDHSLREMIEEGRS